MNSQSIPTGSPQVLAEGLNFPEGPAFTSDGELWCTELGAGNLIRILGEGKYERIPTDGTPNSMAFDSRGLIWVCDSGQNSIRTLDPQSGEWQTIVDVIEGEPLLAPNDLCFDRAGNLLFTCPNFANNEVTGYVVCLTPEGEAIRIASGYHQPNGIEIVDDGAMLVVADTSRGMLYKGAWDGETRIWSDVTEWCRVGGAVGPDGMTFGADGLLYQAIFGDGVVRVVNHEGEILREIAVPGRNVTNAAIDPSGRLGLVVTETEKGQLLSYPEIQPGEAMFRGG